MFQNTFDKKAFFFKLGVVLIRNKQLKGGGPMSSDFGIKIKFKGVNI